MFIPEWFLWSLSGLVWILSMWLVGRRSTGSYDFVTPMIVIGIFCCGCAITLGVFLGRMLGG